MDEKQYRFLSLSGQWPVRLTVEEVAWLLNCRSHAIAALVAARLLKPLGNPPTNGLKFFFTPDVQEAIKDHNDRKNNRPAKASRNGHPPVLVYSATAAGG